MGTVAFVICKGFQSSKLDFRSLKCQFDVKKANFRGLTAKIGYLKPILKFRTHLWPIFMDCAKGTVGFVILKGF